MDVLQDIFSQTWQWTGIQLLTAFAIVLGSFIARWIFSTFLERAARRLAQRTKTDLDDLLIQAVEKPMATGILIFGIYLAVHSFDLSPKAQEWLSTAFWIPYSFLIAWTMFRVVDVLSVMLQRWAQRTESTLDDQLVPLVVRAAKVFVWILAVLMILQNMGYSISGLIAGLGVGGLAVAFAAQKTLSDVFGSAMLLIDRPFVLGDWIQSPNQEIEGVVERIGFRSTSIRTFDQTLVSVPNSRLSDFVINNISERPVRRVWITIGLTYGTPVDKMQEAVSGIDALLRTHHEVDQNSTILVRFTEFGESSLNIMVYYFANTVVWADYLRIREDLNLRFMEVIEDLGLAIALPTRTVHVQSAPYTGNPEYSTMKSK